jgi:hypothetical protein
VTTQTKAPAQHAPVKATVAQLIEKKEEERITAPAKVEKKAPTKIVILEHAKFLASGSHSILEFFPAQYIVDPHLIAAVMSHGVKHHDVSDQPMPSRILIRRTGSVPAPNGGSVSVQSGEIVADPWRVMCCVNGNACFDIVDDGAA